MSLSRLVALLALFGIAAGLVACGRSDGGPASTEAVETADSPVELPKRWKRHSSTQGGFMIGVPPGWSAKNVGATTQIRAPDGLLVISIVADRTEDALGAELQDYAEQTVHRLTGFRRLRTGDPKPFRAAYPAVAVRGRGIARNGIRQRIRLIVMRRPGTAAYAILVASNAAASPGLHGPEAKRILRSLRGQPVA